MKRVLILSVLAGAALHAQAANPQNPTIRQYQLERDGLEVKSQIPNSKS